MANGTGRLGDHQAISPYKTITTETRPLGPLQTPITTQAPISRETQELVNRLDRLPFLVAREFRKAYRKQGRDGQDFIVTVTGGTPTITIAKASLATVCTLTVQENFEGALHHLGVKVIPPGGFKDIKWSIRINGTIYHPGFHDLVFCQESISNPLPFEMELLQVRVVELMAQNTNATDDIDVAGILFGSTAFMSDWKNWGQYSISGIG